MSNAKWIKEIRSLSSKRNREEAGLFVAEGPKVVGDLIAARWTFSAVYASQAGCDRLPEKLKAVATLVPEDVLERISFLQHPQGVVGLFHLRKHRETPLPSSDELYLALDGVQDPGNVGTIIRIADWFGINRIYCSPDTADAYGTLLDGENMYEKALTPHGIIVMGNEGNGISEALRGMIGNRLLIPNFRPAGQGAESLNVAVATAIVCSEFRRK